MKTKKAKPKPADPPDFLPACRKLGKAVAWSFYRVIRKARGCEQGEAASLFQTALMEGKIKEAGRSLLGDVIFFEAV